MLFIGGIHGVGKTYFCNKLSVYYSIEHYSASSLISEEKKELLAKDKRVDQIDRNQDLLLMALNRKVKLQERFLLDGHFCLLNKVGEISQIPFETFSALSPKGIIVLTDSIDTVSERLQARDGRSYEKSLLNSFQKDEVNYAETIASRLNVPFLVYDSSDKPEIYHDFLSLLGYQK
ncbi:AAA family ATPase [Paenibacillus sp. CGMCC 1.16610]|uniref:AAA family ATPase n=1 Tax=Paenibacillus anseongense TaxID=2682845 RepID=A0ABW9UEP4_9BACL|nr:MULTISPECIES: ATP-binding protein [Paenibacillus]MBA2943927.1 AAA family ATPase [Paenibacillus sp. CGMCC 1.16610]MVQ37816.1 AAA family ATPase [Paenibacillus anseongense]